MEDLAGYIIDGRYRLDEVIGQGAVGVVYRGTQLVVDRPCAVKLLRSFGRVLRDGQVRFEREARTMARLNHPNCVTLYDFGYDEERDLLFMVLEYVDGEDLMDRITDGALDQELALKIILQVGVALDHAHSLGLVHRDLKSSNIMLTNKHGVVRAQVLDFGLVRLADEFGGEISEASDDSAPPRRLTQSGMIFGTPFYMSPEQCAGESGLTSATDIYSLGVIAFELLTGEAPIGGETVPELLHGHINAEPKSLPRSLVPGEIVDVVGRMLSKDPAKRPSAAEVVGIVGRHSSVDLSGEFQMIVVPSLPTQAPAFSAPESGVTSPIDALQTSAGRSGLAIGLVIGLAVSAIAALTLSGGGDDPGAVALQLPAAESTAPAVEEPDAGHEDTSVDGTEPAEPQDEAQRAKPKRGESVKPEKLKPFQY